MNEGRIKIIYHPVKQEISFKRYTNGAFALINSDMSVLKKYFTGEKGSFILQNKGNEFFDDIFSVMNEAERVIIDFEGTTIDFGDLRRMIDYYNNCEKKKCDDSKEEHVDRFIVGKLTELQDAGVIYNSVKKYAFEIVSKFSNNDALIQGTIQESINNLKNKIDNLDENDVNLCFVGAYSSGKSKLINAILGYAILPESIEPETTEIYKIVNVNCREKAKLCFDISHYGQNSIAEINWQEGDRIFTFDSGPDDDPVRDAIQKVINDNKNAEQHKQLQLILSIINELSANKPSESDPTECYIEGIITVYYPIPLCDDINFAIFDTPGTDSDSDEHLKILKEALRSQSNSILIFVNKGDSVAGEGNSVLLRLLKDVEEEKSKTTIDLGRSLYVINKADTLDEDDFYALRKKTICIKKMGDENDLGFSIDLTNKRLFFVSARAAYAGRTMMNQIQTKIEANHIKQLRYSLLDDENAGYYRYNSLALARQETEDALKLSQEKYEHARVEEDVAMQFIVNSGLFALEAELVKYGRKYALAVKAQGLIDGIGDIVGKLKSEYSFREVSKKKDSKELEQTIKKLKEDMTKAIMERCSEFKRNGLDFSKLAELNIDGSAISKCTSDARDKVSGKLGFWERFGKDAEDIHSEMFKELNSLVTAHRNIFINKRKTTLLADAQKLRNAIVEEIQKIDGVDNEIKGRIADISDVDIPEANITGQINFKLYTKEKFFGGFKFRGKKGLSGYKEKAIQVFNSEMDRRKENYGQEYESTILSMFGKIEKAYLENINNSVGTLKALMDNKDAVDKELQWCKEKLDILNNISAEIDNEIWGRK